MSLLDLITGGKSSAASGDMERALAAIQGVRTPTVEEMTFQLQKLVQAGKITPEQARTFLQNPNALSGMTIDQTGTDAQQRAIADLLGAAEAGGLSPAEQSAMGEITRQLNSQEKGANDAVLQNAAARGTLTGGETIAAQLANNQNGTANANQLALGTAGQAYQNMLNELTSAGSMGSGLQGQQNNQANTVAAATNAINQFNATQQQQQENYNVGNTNAAQAANVENLQNIENTNVGNENQRALYEAQLPQQVYEDQIQKAAAEAGVSENQANLATQQGGQQASLIGNLIGAGGQVAASGFAPKPVQTHAAGGEIHNYLSGGEVIADDPRERARLAGDNPANDRVPAFLSEGEIVLPRSVAEHPDPDRVMAFLQRIRKPKPEIHPEDTAHVLRALSLVREGSHAA